MIDKIDIKIIKIIQENKDVSIDPFAEISEIIGIPEDEVIQRIKKMKEKGVIRRFGAVLRHQKAGLTANGMIVWDVPDEKAEEVGKIFAQFREVSHCYERPRQKHWNYNIFTMVHGKSKEECKKIAEKLAKAADIHKYDILFSTKEFKKSSMKYFTE